MTSLDIFINNVVDCYRYMTLMRIQFHSAIPLRDFGSVIQYRVTQISKSDDKSHSNPPWPGTQRQKEVSQGYAGADRVLYLLEHAGQEACLV